MNGTCFQDPIGLIKFSISPEFVPLLMDEDLLHKIFVSLREIKQELYAKSFQVNLKRDAKDLSRDLQRLEVRGKLGSKLSNTEHIFDLASQAMLFGLLKVTRPSFLGGYHPTLKLSGNPSFTFILSQTHRMNNI